MKWILSRGWPLSTAVACLPASFALYRIGQESVNPPEVRVWVENGPRDRSVDILFVGDGYQRKHLGRAGKYWKDVERCSKQLFEEFPFSWYAARFNVRALFLESKDEGCDPSLNADEVDTALSSSFDTLEGRSLAFLDHEELRRQVSAAGGADVVFVMVNTERYGGAGTTLRGLTAPGVDGPAPTYSAQDSRSFLIAIHELGHSFADLADEYAEQELQWRHPLPKDRDLPAANVTLPGHFVDSDFEALRRTLKWGHFLKLRRAEKYEWLFEGGYYREEGVFRPFAYCRMREHGDPFCPICCEEMTKAIFAVCGDAWDDAAYHEAHPLDRATWSMGRR